MRTLWQEIGHGLHLLLSARRRASWQGCPMSRVPARWTQGMKRRKLLKSGTMWLGCGFCAIACQPCTQAGGCETTCTPVSGGMPHSHTVGGPIPSVQFLVQRYANLFHFVSHLAEMPVHPYRDAWIHDTGPLTANEEAALSDFRDLIKRYPIDPKPPEGSGRFLQRPFTLYGDVDVWETVRQWVDDEKDCALAQRIFSIFEPRFKGLWKREEPLLKAWKDALPNLICRIGHARIARDLASFHRAVSSIGESLRVYLVMSLEFRLGGSSEVGPDAVIVHCSRVPHTKWGNAHVLWTLYHEWTHTFQWDYLLPMILDFAGEEHNAEAEGAKPVLEQGGLIGYLFEAYARLVGSYLFRREYPELAGSSPAKFLRVQDKALFDLVRGYVEEHRPVDQSFMLEFWRIARGVSFEVT